MKINWFRVIVVLILIAGVGIYGWSENNRSMLAKEKQEAEMKLKDREISLKEAELENRKAEEQRKQIERSTNDSLRTSCLDDADNSYRLDWDGACKIEMKDDNCSLAIVAADRINKIYQGYKDDCFKKYPVGQ